MKLVGKSIVIFARIVSTISKANLSLSTRLTRNRVVSRDESLQIFGIPLKLIDELFRYKREREGPHSNA